MSPETRPEYFALSELLRFPDPDLIASLPEIGALLLKTLEKTGTGCAELLSFLTEGGILAAQELYTAAFDLDPSTSLELTYHLRGDGKERGKAMAELMRRYRSEGYAPAGGELPDYLPLMLEFFSVCPGPVLGEIAAGYAEIVLDIGKRLREKGNPYAGVLAAAGELMEDASRGEG